MSRLAHDCQHWRQIEGEADGYGQCTGPLAKAWRNTLIRCRGIKWQCQHASKEGENA